MRLAALHRWLAAPALFALTSVAAAQARVIPPAFANHEGDWGFGLRVPNVAFQLLDEASLIATTPTTLRALSFRADGDRLVPYGGFTRSYAVDLCTTTRAPTQMSLDPVANRGSTPTRVFAGPLNAPSVVPGSPLPHPFAFRFAFTTPFPYAPASGNLLIDVTTTDTVPAPGAYVIDALSLGLFGDGWVPIVTVAAGCANSRGNRLDLELGGGVLGRTLTSTLRSAQGAFAYAALSVGLTNRAPGYPIDLSPLGMTGCSAAVEPVLTVLVAETGGTWPRPAWQIPGDASLDGLVLFEQAFGVSTSLVDAVMSPASAVMLAPPTPPSITSNVIYLTALNRWEQAPSTVWFTLIHELTR